MSEDTTPRLARLRARFELLDANGDGRLQADDFRLLVDRVADALTVDGESAKVRALAHGCRVYWDGLAGTADSDRDNTVTFDEYVAALPDADHFDSYGRPYARALAALADRDDDGYIEQGDFLATMTAIGFSRSRAVELFAALSRDDRVATAVWETAIRDYYVNASADIPGQVLAPQSA
ncbi:EF-hand domain-containing protein [Nonomuraea rhizosphaerae]|uniref:EF-hand domain-containing protein n=1 Tax=Nonomuraea rhizosphaerae TaxID=2665663 RepID=UPI001C5FA19A|nr:calcium-binding protein [Nonomuraea rhizosphaerae]